MAFKRVRSLDGDVQPFEYYLLTDSEAVTAGEALVQTNGRLTKAGATATPEFIAEATLAAGTNVIVPVTRITEQDFFNTTASATVAATLVGNKVTIDADGLRVTATTTSGVFEITKTDGAIIVEGMFRR